MKFFVFDENGTAQFKPELTAHFQSELGAHIHRNLQATPLQAELSKYFVSSEKLEELSALLNDFHLAIPQRRVASSMSKVSTSKINELFNSITRMLKDEIDVLMMLFEESEPDFYNAYKNARIIVDYNGRGRVNGDETTPPPVSPS